MKYFRCGFTTCSFSYLYILFTVILYFLKNCILSFSELSSNEKINIFGIQPVLIKHGLMKLLIEYIGYIIFGGLFLYIFRLRKMFTNKKKEIIHTKNIELIYTKRYVSSGSIKLLLIACCLFAIQLIIRNIMNLLKLWMLDLWIFNIIFISFFMKIILKTQIYKHQLFSLGINFFINFALLIVASSLKESDNGYSQFDTIANNFGNHFYIVLFYFVFLALSAIQCFSQVIQKQLMDNENESPFTILFIIGIISAFFTIIALLITTYVKCNSILQEKEFCTNNAGYFDSFIIFKNILKS